jgi:hypothetical protein
MRWTFLSLAASGGKKTVLSFRRLGFIATVLLGSVTLAAAQEIPALVELSREVAAAHPDLAVQRAALVQERQALHARFNQHNQRCTDIDPENKATISDCTREHGELLTALKAHIARSESFNAAPRAALPDAQWDQTRTNSTPPVTKHLEYRGDFYVLTADGRKLTGDAHVPITMGSRIVTGPNARLDLTLLDDTRFMIGPNSDFVVDEFVYDPSSSVAKVTASLAKGLFRWVTGKLPPSWKRQEDLHVRGDAIVIRGTDMEISVVPDGAGYIKLFEGQLQITEKKSGDVFQMNAGQMVTLNADGTAGRPIPLKQNGSKN